MPCPPDNTCAHQASRYLSGYYPQLDAGQGSDMRNAKGYLRCKCGLMLRAHQMGSWAQSKGFAKVANYSNQGVYLIHQTNDKDGSGHVFCVINGQFKGNGNYNWNKATRQTIYKLK